MKPVYLINGFLESGKSTFLDFTIQQNYFQIKGTTLLILCEEGEVEFKDSVLKNTRTIIERIENEEDFTPANLMELEKRWKPERILIEYNGMWNRKEMALPFHWNLEQQITCIDASTFPMYYNNMKSLVTEMIRNSELIIFNRCDSCMDNLATYRRNVKAVNAGAEVVFENAEGEINQIFEEDLPYDLQASTIELDDNTFGIWYMDMMDHTERYEGKEIIFTGMALIQNNFPKGCFVPGRMAMTCCADDMQFLGYICKYEKASELKNRDWVKVTVRPKREFWEGYQGVGPVLYATKVEKTSKPKNDIISFGM